ncbi:L-aspartate oxidase [Demequina sp. SYSU T00039]|uniref:L-aspartate oxidase n=1 Tax=Demequina lignilytica TaxID=3051663 RepID=A0AAW7M6T2_9MICO|nr:MULTISPECIES: L-aspartate oxidase [unclassified Demequina]MDN4477473.1 L-aspartate oxidase [Demequina sp. SYSU T00039-1]MDN4488176.1 L-aspartate oxidase [Demequina sp. SYSU T00039]
MTAFVRQLAAPQPGWTIETDVIVVGSGIAGLTTVLDLREKVDRVLLVTKGVLSSGSTVWAQGGIAAAMDPEDTPDEHLEDTLVAGAGLCSEEAVRVLVTEGPHSVRKLVRRGTQFDLGPDGDLTLTREGGHHRDRIAHAGGDATGAEISRALIEQLDAIRNDPGIEVIEHAMVVDLLTGAPDAEGRPGPVCGATLHIIGEGQRDGVGAALAKAVIIATGGIGQVFRSSTNPASATGDGLAVGLRAGAAVADVEYVQFHPTVLWQGANARGQLPLISEAVRGEGAYLLNGAGERFMVGRHEMAELAPRDVVSRTIVEVMREEESDSVFLDCRHLDAAFLEQRFPSIWASLAEHGIDMAHDLIPVAPAQHFHSGGIMADLHGRSTQRGLYAIGEAACTGVHGANRLASNSLLEGTVFGRRAARDASSLIADGVLRQLEPEERRGDSALVPATMRTRVQAIAHEGAGPMRDGDGLDDAVARLARIRQRFHTDPVSTVVPQTAEWETTNIVATASVLCEAALLREESRGGHQRSDYPQTDPEWAVRLAARLDPDGRMEFMRAPLEIGG